MMTYDEAIAYIHSVNWRGSRPGLSRITELLEKLGNPEKTLKCIHIGGTNGKGSTSAMLDSILRAAGYSVGSFTSPYIEVFNERIMLDGQPISNEDLCRYLSTVAPIAEAMTDKPTEFELITALGFLYFKEKKCDYVVLEVGMGGRLDSTNVIESPVLSIITGIALDHVAVLGDSVEKIAYEKAGIIKEACPILYGGDDLLAQSVIEREALLKNAPFFVTDRASLTVHESGLHGSRFDFKAFRELSISLAGMYQTRNASTVLTAIELLRDVGLTIPDTAVRKGLSETKWRARFEVLCDSPLFVFDGSHNKQGIDAAAESIGRYFEGKPVLLLTGVMADKAYGEMIDTLLPFVKKVFTVTPDNPRALSADSLAAEYRARGAEAFAYDTVEMGVKAVLREGVATAMPIVALGSLYMYGEVKGALKKLLSE